jgi:hypothetical protein
MELEKKKKNCSKEKMERVKQNCFLKRKIIILKKKTLKEFLEIKN